MKKHFSLRIIFLAACMMVMLSFSAGSAEAASFNAYRTATTTGIESGGTFIKTAKGIRYRRANGTYVVYKWAAIGGKVYMFDRSGYARKGHFTAAGNFYRSDSTGALLRNRRYTLAGSVYYYGPTCAMVRSAWANIGGNYYYFGSDGKMVTNRWVGNYFVNRNGVRMSGLNRQTLINTSSLSERKHESKLIFIGASRVVQMGQATGAARFTSAGVTWNPVYIARSGQGFPWFSSTAYPKLRAYLSLFPNSKVVIQMGNNDMRLSSDMNIKLYIAAYRNLMKLYPNAEFYFMDALPSKVESMNKRRVIFNQKLKAAFPNNYIGGYAYLMQTGFTTRSATDTTHYDQATYKKIYRYILKKAGLL